MASGAPLRLKRTARLLWVGSFDTQPTERLRVAVESSARDATRRAYLRRCFEKIGVRRAHHCDDEIAYLWRSNDLGHEIRSPAWLLLDRGCIGEVDEKPFRRWLLLFDLATHSPKRFTALQIGHLAEIAQGECTRAELGQVESHFPSSRAS